MNEIDFSLTKMIIYDNEALRMLEREGFRAYTFALDPNYRIPDRRTILHNLSEIEVSVKTRIKDLLDHADSVTVCADMWSSRRLKSYLGIIVYFHVEDQSMNATLSCNYSSGRHIGLKIAQSLINEINSWGINESKMTAFVSDNGSDMVKCF